MGCDFVNQIFAVLQLTLRMNLPVGFQSSHYNLQFKVILASIKRLEEINMRPGLFPQEICNVLACTSIEDTSLSGLILPLN